VKFLEDSMFVQLYFRIEHSFDCAARSAAPCWVFASRWSARMEGFEIRWMAADYSRRLGVHTCFARTLVVRSGDSHKGNLSLPKSRESSGEYPRRYRLGSQKVPKKQRV